MSIFSLSSMQEFIIYIGVKLLVIVAILPVHEYAHARMAKRMGDNTAEIMGRMTLNPLAHIHPVGALMIILTGFGFANPVPVIPRNFRNYRKGMALTSLAGPLSNIICAFIGYFIYKVATYVVGIYFYEFYNNAMSYLFMAVEIFILLNINIAVFNLIPIPPLDGSNIFLSLAPRKLTALYYKYVHPHQKYVSMIFFALIVFGILDEPLSFLSNLVFRLLDYSLFWVDLIFQALI